MVSLVEGQKVAYSILRSYLCWITIGMISSPICEVLLTKILSSSSWYLSPRLIIVTNAMVLYTPWLWHQWHKFLWIPVATEDPAPESDSPLCSYTWLQSALCWIQLRPLINTKYVYPLISNNMSANSLIAGKERQNLPFWLRRGVRCLLACLLSPSSSRPSVGQIGAYVSFVLIYVVA